MPRDAIRLSAAALRAVWAFENLPEPVLQSICDAASARRVPRGEVIVAFQDRDRDLYFLISGTARVSVHSASGRALTYDLLPPGELFGETSAIDGDPRSASVSAETECVVAHIPHEVFAHLVETSPPFAMAIMRRLTRLTRRTTQRVFIYNAYKVKGRIIAEYLDLDERSPGDWFAVTDRDVASRIGTTRSNVANLRHEMLEEQLIEWNASKVRVLDREGLIERLAAQEKA